jgi:8-amino-7-oxononanoate synthase
MTSALVTSTVASHPPNDFDQELTHRLDSISEKGLRRELRRIASPQSARIQFNGQTFLNFSSNDYLGLANDSILKNASVAAIEQVGAGAGSSRLLCGSLAPCHDLDDALADFKQTAGALSFSSGYSAALGTICALMSSDDIIVLDKQVHACMVDAARLSGATMRVFRHNDLDQLQNLLEWAAKRSRTIGQSSSQFSPSQKTSKILILTESIFSMDGSHAPLKEIVALKQKYGAWLMLDEAHATGICGPNRRGLAEKCGVSSQIEIQMGTLGKALGASGGFICGSRPLIDYLVNRARSFMFSTAPVPAAAAAARAGIDFVRSDPGRNRAEVLWQRVAEFGLNPPIYNQESKSAIFPMMLGSETRAVAVANALLDQGIFIPAVRYPTVPRSQARLRLTVTASHSAADIEKARSALAGLGAIS